MAETDEKEAQLTAYYDKEMGAHGAREEYAAVMAANPTFETSSASSFKQTLAAGRFELGIRDLTMQFESPPWELP